MVEVGQYELPDGEEVAFAGEGFDVRGVALHSEGAGAEVPALADLGFGEGIDHFRGKLRQQTGSAD